MIVSLVTFLILDIPSGVSASDSSHLSIKIHHDESSWLLSSKVTTLPFVIPRGGGIIPGGYNPFGYRITALGEEFLKFEGSSDSDVGRLLTTLRKRKKFQAIKEQWLEVLRVSKSGQSMRIYRLLKELLDFAVKAGFVD